MPCRAPQPFGHYYHRGALPVNGMYGVQQPVAEPGPEPEPEPEPVVDPKKPHGASWQHFHSQFPFVDQDLLQKALDQDEAAMKQVVEQAGQEWPVLAWRLTGYGDCGWNAAAFNTSYAKYYQDQLSSHAEFEHKRYLEKRETIVSNAELRQQELLQKEAELTQAEEEHEQFLMERKKLLQESENEYRRSTQAEYPSEYYHGFSHQNPRGKALDYEHQLINKHRLEKYKKDYLEDLDMIENYHTKYKDYLENVPLEY